MTPEILQWLEQVAKPYLLPSAGRVLEVGAFDVNGSPRSVIQSIASEYIGTDMQAGAGVDVVVNNRDLADRFKRTYSDTQFNTIICCECLEHDSAFWDTAQQMHYLLRSGGHLIITTPALGFPYHAYPRHYYNFTRDAYEDIFFAEMEILNITALDNQYIGKGVNLAGIARKR